MTQDATALYGIWAPSVYASPSVYGLSKQGGTPWVVASVVPGYGAPSWITALCGKVIWEEQPYMTHLYQVSAAPTPCGPRSILIPYGFFDSNGYLPIRVWDDQYLYTNGTTGRTVDALDWSGNIVFTWDAGSWGVAQDATHLYFEDFSQTLVLQVAEKDGGSLSLLASVDSGFVSGINVAGGAVYWYDQDKGGIWSLSTTDAGSPSLVLPGCSLSPFVVDPGGLYVRECDAGTVVRLFDGGLTTMTPPDVGSFVVDEQFLFWVSFMSQGDVVVRRPK